jgi:hypothetical protein
VKTTHRYLKLAIPAVALVMAILACAQPAPSPSAIPGKPSVFVVAPVDGSRVPLGQPTTIQVNGTDAQGVTRIEIKVDGTLAGTTQSPAAGGQANLTAAQSWTFTEAGRHVIEAQAFNTGGRPSDLVAVTVHAEEDAAQETTPGAAAPTAAATGESPAVTSPPPATSETNPTSALPTATAVPSTPTQTPQPTSPPATSLGTDLSAISYLDGAGKPRIYAFAKGQDVRLYVNYWDGAKWHWAGQGMPAGANVYDNPGAITYKDGARRIYAFARGKDSRLYVNYWDGAKWRWADQGKPASANVVGTPGVITYKDGAQRIYAFVRGSDGHLHVNYWDGTQWRWADQGTPPGASVAGNPSVVSYQEGTQRIYAFVMGDNGHLYVNYWDGSKWRWADQGTPPGASVAGAPAAITHREAGAQRIYAFVVGSDDRLHVNYWDGAKWHWADQGTP